jgi:hypothetical protein
LESSVVGRTRFACLFSVVIFIALRALSHAHPAPLPWTSGVFDEDGLDDLLQTIRVAYTPTGDPHRGTSGLATPTGRMAVPEPAFVRMPFLGATRSRAPPSP